MAMLSTMASRVRPLTLPPSHQCSWSSWFFFYATEKETEENEKITQKIQELFPKKKCELG
jgi:hypothetical protein